MTVSHVYSFSIHFCMENINTFKISQIFCRNFSIWVIHLRQNIHFILFPIIC